MVVVAMQGVESVREQHFDHLRMAGARGPSQCGIAFRVRSGKNARRSCADGSHYAGQIGHRRQYDQRVVCFRLSADIGDFDARFGHAANFVLAHKIDQTGSVFDQA